MVNVSVVVTFHNVQEFAQNTLRSLMCNARQDREFILVDDCSTDATPQVLEREAERLPNARVIRHESNLGISCARNSGIDVAKGRYLTFLDGDDWYAPGYLDALTEAMDKLDCDVLRTDHVQARDKSRSVTQAPAPRRGVPLSARDCIGPVDRRTMVDYPFVWAGMYHSRLFADGANRFSPELRTAEDRLWTWRMHLAAERMAITDVLGVFYRRGVQTSLTQVGDDRQLDFIPAHDAVLSAVLADEEAERFLPKALRTYCALIVFHLQNTDRLDSRLTRRLKAESAAALRRMPREPLREVLSGMDNRRRVMLQRLLDGRRAGRGTRWGRAA